LRGVTPLQTRALAPPATRRSANLAPVLAEIKASGITTLGGTARALNERNIPTARGQGSWQAVQVQRVLERISD
jgi:hypothetical protein